MNSVELYSIHKHTHTLSLSCSFLRSFSLFTSARASLFGSSSLAKASMTARIAVATTSPTTKAKAKTRYRLLEKSGNEHAFHVRVCGVFSAHLFAPSRDLLPAGNCSTLNCLAAVRLANQEMSSLSRFFIRESCFRSVPFRSFFSFLSVGGGPHRDRRKNDYTHLNVSTHSPDNYFSHFLILLCSMNDRQQPHSSSCTS